MSRRGYGSLAAGRFSRFMLVLGFLFLYLPIISLIIFSFNYSRLVTVWDSANSPSLRWYQELLNNEALLGAAWLSVQVAALTATLAVVLGTLAAFALLRAGPLRSRALLSAMIGAPLVMPEIITGLSLLLLFVTLEQWLGWPAGRGMLTIVIAHATLAMAYVAVVVQSRLASFDRSLEEAALDLGATPTTVFWRITLPLMWPALLSGWLLAFTLSWDDVVIAQFVAGPNASTLPMWVFSKLRLGVSPEINALATLVILFVALVLGCGTWLSRRRERQVQRPVST
ncbi:MAG: ABC transporter permease subunit [Steroidobacteraceae bacterium]|jgi:putrescine transport system permease protein|nr:ABC transporter permease subunit [Gammaproteobacteria bacterium]